MQRCGGDGDEATHAVPDHDRAAGDACCVSNGEDLVGPLLQLVVRSMAAVTVAGQVDGHDPVLVGERRRNVRPPVRACAATVHEHQTAPARLAPCEVVDRLPADDDRAVLERHGERAPEPTRRIGMDRDVVVRRHPATLREGATRRRANVFNNRRISAVSPAAEATRDTTWQ
jgi:hypothetical protein